MVDYKPVLTKKQIVAYHHAKSSCEDIQAQISDNSLVVWGGYGANLTTRNRQGIPFLLYTKDTERTEYISGKHNLKKVIWQSTGRIPGDNALAWLRKENIAFAIYNMDMEIVATNQTTEFQDDDLLKKQLNMYDSQKVSYARDIIRQKVSGQISVVSEFSGLLRNGHVIASKMEDMFPDSGLAKFSFNQDAVMAFEALEAGLYWSSWRGMQVPWAEGENEIEQYRAFPGRSQGLKDSNRAACDPINAMLNFSYFTLEDRILTAIRHAGLSTQASFLHAPHKNRHNLIYDLIEVLRPKVDRAILKFLKSYKLQWSFFNVNKNVFTVMHAFGRVLTALIEREISDKDISDIVDHYVGYLTGSITVEHMPSAIGRKLDLPSYKAGRAEKAVKRGPSKKTLAFRAIKDAAYSDQIKDAIARDRDSA